MSRVDIYAILTNAMALSTTVVIVIIYLVFPLYMRGWLLAVPFTLKVISIVLECWYEQWLKDIGEKRI